MIGVQASGSFKKTLSFLQDVKTLNIRSDLDRWGQMGVNALARATPVESGETARSWTYEVVKTKTETSIHWINTHENDGANIAILLQYGHGTGTGGYVAGYDYINPAIQPIFDRISDEFWTKITSA